MTEQLALTAPRDGGTARAAHPGGSRLMTEQFALPAPEGAGS